MNRCRSSYGDEISTIICRIFKAAAEDRTGLNVGRRDIDSIAASVTKHLRNRDGVGFNCYVIFILTTADGGIVQKACNDCNGVIATIALNIISGDSVARLNGDQITLVVCGVIRTATPDAAANNVATSRNRNEVSVGIAIDGTADQVETSSDLNGVVILATANLRIADVECSGTTRRIQIPNTN